jgi:periplasmic protein TonB
MTPSMLAVRIPVSLALSLLLSGLMFWTLWAMIHVEMDVAEMRTATRIEFTRMRKDTDVESKRDEKIEMEQPLVAPEIPQMSFNAGGVENVVTTSTVVIDTRGAMTGINFAGGGSDRDVIPLVRINPDYPQRALSRGIEGWVIVQFTITAEGTVKDAKVVSSEPKGIFDDAAVKAILRWRYNPKVVEGVAVERVGIQVRLTFDLDEG